MKHPRSKKVETTHRAILRLVGRLDLEEVVREKRACHAWADIVGKSIAMRSCATRLKKGTLYVTIENPAWLVQLRHMEDNMLERLAETLGPGVVQRMSFRIGALPPLPPEPVPEPPLPELTQSEAEACAERAGALSDPELRDAARRALEAHARRVG